MLRKARQQYVTVEPINALDRPNARSGLSFAAGEVKISKDNGAFANVTNLPVEIGTSGVYGMLLTAAECNADWIHLYAERATVIDRWRMSISTTGHPSFSVVANGSNTATTFKTDRAETGTDFWKMAWVVFTSGGLIDQVRQVSAYDGTTKFVTMADAFSAAPSASDLALLINI